MDIVQDILRGLLGMSVFIGACYLISTDRKAVDWRLVGMGLGLQILLAFLMLKVPLVRGFFRLIVNFFVLMIDAAGEAAQFLFGDLALAGGAFGFAFSVLPTIVFFSNPLRF